MGLSDYEYNLILNLIGRTPTQTELGMFAVMWSEHCGYKYSRKVLEAFKKYKHAVQGQGLENAGVVDIGDGFGITFKVESHNHPSAVEPYEGAATGVGGIIRDILTMGAKPIALLNSLRFGPIVEDGESDPETIEKNRYLFEHVVSGIAGYGNCVGVPTVGGEIGFHPSYSGNPLVNAMCVGILKLDEITTAAATGIGNCVLYLGSSTGKDGIHGATFASDELGEENQTKRPNVQIGDPFAEKLLIEATLEALQTGAILAIQDMGAAGLTCSTVEMASKGGIGMSINLDKVPMREQDMNAYELMLSESQERMLAVVSSSRIHEVLTVFDKWGLPALVIGETIADRKIKVYRFGNLEAEIDPWWLTENCPFYSSELIEPEVAKKAPKFSLDQVTHVQPEEACLMLISEPENASKKWIYRQFDRKVLTQTVFSSGESDAAVLMLRGTKKPIAMTLDCNSRQTLIAPYIGAWNSVHEAARNLACSGATPLATTDGLNFGNPQNPEVFFQFSQAVQGLANACEAVNAPVVSGNVSFYNQTKSQEILPTPLVGMVGILGSIEGAIPSAPKEITDELRIVLLAPQQSIAMWESDRLYGLGSSSYLSLVLNVENGVPLKADARGESNLRNCLIKLAQNRLIESAHDVSEGGLLVTLMEVCIDKKIGAEVSLNGLVKFDMPQGLLFGEVPGLVIVTCLASKIEKLASMVGTDQIKLFALGRFKKDRLQIDESGREHVWSMQEIIKRHEYCIPQLLQD